MWDSPCRFFRQVSPAGATVSYIGIQIAPLTRRALV